MPGYSARVRTRTLLLALCVIGCALAFTTAASAAPGTVRSPDGSLSMTTSNTTPAPGETITVSFSYVVAPGENGTYGSLAFGVLTRTNLDRLSFNDDCAGALSRCVYDAAAPRPATAFAGFTPAGRPGDTIAGSATFTVDPAAAPGTTIAYDGLHSGDGGVTVVTAAQTLTVTAPAAADIAVGLTARGSLLGGTVDYTVTARNGGPSAVTFGSIGTPLPAAALSVTSSACSLDSRVDVIVCPTGPLANGATVSLPFRVTYRLLTIGLPLRATATRDFSMPADPNAANDSASANCLVLTGLVIAC